MLMSSFRYPPPCLFFHRYVTDGEVVSFNAVAKRCQAMGEVLMGFQNPDGETFINPGIKTEDGAVSQPEKDVPVEWADKSVVVLIPQKHYKGVVKKVRGGRRGGTDG